MFISIALVRALYGHLRDSGQDAPAFLRTLGTGESQLEQSRVFLPLSNVVRAVQVGCSWHSASSAVLAQTIAAPALGLVGSLLIHCATMRVALDQAQRCLPLLLSGATLSVQEDGQLARVGLNLPWMEDRELRFITDLAAASLLRGVRALEASSPGNAVFLPYARPQGAEHQAVFNCPVHFSASRTEVVFAAEILDRPLPHADQDAYLALDDCARGLLSSHNFGQSLQQKLEALLMKDPSLYHVGADTLAERLGLTLRTLRRRLKEEGSSCSQVVTNARYARACRLLADTTISIKDIAQELRFSEASAFHRCFRRWTGTTPSRYRKSKRRQASRGSQLGRRFDSDVMVA